jgi:hypothetical protein
MRLDRLARSAVAIGKTLCAPSARGPHQEVSCGTQDTALRLELALACNHQDRLPIYSAGNQLKSESAQPGK